MFTGIIETTGRIGKMTPAGNGLKVELLCDDLADKLSMDDSVAVNGICLTVVKLLPSGFAVDVVGETVSRSTVSTWQPGMTVNLERGMPADGRFDGHLVQGHVDGMAELASRHRSGESEVYEFKADSAITDLMVEKGSVAVNGISLTIAALTHDGFRIALIPYTLSNTTIGDLRPGAKVNIETDIIGKYLVKFLKQKPELNSTTLRSWGYDL